MNDDLQKEFETLSAQWLADEADDAATTRLLDICKKHPAYLTDLADLTSIDRLLPLLEEPEIIFSEEIRCRLTAERGGDAFATSVSDRIQPKKNPLRFVPVIVAVAAAIAVMLVLPDDDSGTQGPATQASIATINNEVAANWENGFAPDGTNIPKGQYHLVGGLASMEFKSGVTMIVEAPARFSIENEERVVLIDGTVTANVPDGAEGFTVDTSSTRVIDRGTEFAVSASPTGETEVHVLQGIVDTHPLSDNSTMLRLTENQARTFNGISNESTYMEAEPNRFYRDLPSNDQTYNWLHWGFDEGKGDVTAASNHGLGHGNTTAIMDTIDKNGPMPEWIPGPFGTAVAFSGRGDYLKTDYMGISGTGARTVAFWVRVPADWTPNNGYGMIGWGSYRYKGSTWQISANPVDKEGPIGHLRIGTGQAQVIGSTDLRDGKWHHVAVVMYGGEEANTSTHIIAFIDGNIDPAKNKSVHAIDTDASQDLPVLMGRNASRNTRGMRCFRGDMDEVYIFDAALSQDEIRLLMNNQPPLAQ